MSTKPKFMVDIDGCVYPFCFASCSLLKLRGNDVEIKEFEYWNWLEDQVPAEEWKWLWGPGVRDVFRAAPPYPGAIKALRRMEEHVRLVFVTHRPITVADITLRFLADHKLHPHAVIHASGEDKSLYLPDVIGFVEDRPENARDLAALDAGPVFVPRRPYNRNISTGGWTRHFDDWKEVSEWVRDNYRTPASA